MNLVWKKAPYRGESLLVLLSLADWANDEGFCYPKVTNIAKKCRMTRRGVELILQRFEQAEIIKIERSQGGIGKPVVRGRKVERIGHSILINIEKLGYLDDVTANQVHSRKKRRRANAVRSEPSESTANVVRSEYGFTTANEFRSEDDLITANEVRGEARDQLTANLVRSDESRTTANAVRSEADDWTTANEIRSDERDNCEPHDTSTANAVENSLRTRKQKPGSHLLHEPSWRHEPSADPSCRHDGTHKPRKFWTLRDDDDGSFSARPVEKAYAELTGNRITRSDRNHAEMLVAAGFSSAAVGELLAEVQKRANVNRIGSLAYFRTAIEELSRRCADAANNAARAHVGSANAAGAVLAAVRREVTLWKKGGK